MGIKLAFTRKPGWVYPRMIFLQEVIFTVSPWQDWKQFHPGKKCFLINVLLFNLERLFTLHGNFGHVSQFQFQPRILWTSRGK